MTENGTIASSSLNSRSPELGTWNRAARLLIVVGGTVSLCFGIVFAGLIAMGEGASDELRVRRQIATQALYHSPFINLHSYKRALKDVHSPEIAVLGTSRAGPFRGAFFNRPFVNFQSIVDSPDQVYRTVEDLFPTGGPLQHLIIVVELWWFADEPKESSSQPVPSASLETRMRNVWRFFRHSKRGAQRRADVWNAVKSGRLLDFLGIHGLVRREGFSSVGSYHYEQIVSGRRESPDQRFAYSLEAAENGEHRFRFGSGLNEPQYARFREVLELLSKRDIDFTLVLAPYAPAVTEKMRGRNFGHYAALLGRFQQDGFQVHDFTFPQQTIGEDDCEYIDGFHGGDVVYARMLAQMARADEKLASHVDMMALNRIEAEGRGLAAWSRFTPEPEIDFLDLGCKGKESP